MTRSSPEILVKANPLDAISNMTKPRYASSDISRTDFSVDMRDHFFENGSLWPPDSAIT
jgi:hypothetical protein